MIIVKMTKDCAKWYLTKDAYDAFVSPKTGEMDEEHQSLYDNMVQLSLLCLMGEPIYGELIRKGNENCYLVKFSINELEYIAYFKKEKDFKIL